MSQNFRIFCNAAVSQPAASRSLLGDADKQSSFKFSVNPLSLDDQDHAREQHSTEKPTDVQPIPLTVSAGVSSAQHVAISRGRSTSLAIPQPKHGHVKRSSSMGSGFPYSTSPGAMDSFPGSPTQHDQAIIQAAHALLEQGRRDQMMEAVGKADLERTSHYNASLVRASVGGTSSIFMKRSSTLARNSGA